MAKKAKKPEKTKDELRNVYPDDGRTHSVGEEPCWCEPKEVDGQRIHNPGGQTV
jgi:hypothetical protein